MALFTAGLRTQNKAVLKDDPNASKPFQAYFFFQYIEPGKDIEKFMNSTNPTNNLKYITLTGESLKISTSQEQQNVIENEVFLADIYDKDIDNAQKGTCCSRITYYAFPAALCMDTPKACKEIEKRQQMFPPTADQMNTDGNLAKNCIDIFIFEQLAYRICHRTADEILKLKQTISYNILKTVVPNNQKLLMANFVTNSSSEPLKAPEYWDWHKQDAWGGNCNSRIMQSPIDLNELEGAKTTSTFAINYSFLDNVPVSITKNAREIQITFDDAVGGFKYQYGEGQTTTFVPKKISFRFPAEHLINGYRFDGEIVIISDELTHGNNQAIAISNGMEFVIPLQFDPNAPVHDFLDVLNPDQWRSSLDKATEYIPTNPLTQKRATLQLQKMMDFVFSQSYDFFLYLGSSTTPPCQDHVVQLIMKGSITMRNCQFIDIRENTLTAENLSETHARNIHTNPYGGTEKIKNIGSSQFHKTTIGAITPSAVMRKIALQLPGDPKKKKASKKEKKKQEQKQIFSSKANCDLQHTYNPPDVTAEGRQAVPAGSNQGGSGSTGGAGSVTPQTQ